MICYYCREKATQTHHRMPRCNGGSHEHENLVDVAHSVQVGIRSYSESDHGFTILDAPEVHQSTAQEITSRINGKQNPNARETSWTTMAGPPIPIKAIAR